MRACRLLSGFSLLITAGAAIMFIPSATSKLRSITAFADAIHRHEILPFEVVPSVAASVAGLEAGLGLLLAVSLAAAARRRWALLWALALLASFSVYLAVVYAVRGADESCSCGALVEATARDGLLRNGGLIALFAGAFVVETRRAPAASAA